MLVASFSLLPRLNSCRPCPRSTLRQDQKKLRSFRVCPPEQAVGQEKGREAWPSSDLLSDPLTLTHTHTSNCDKDSEGKGQAEEGQAIRRRPGETGWSGAAAPGEFSWTSAWWEGVPAGSAVKNLPAMQGLQETWVRSLGWEDPLGEGMTTHSGILAWRIPGQRSLAGYRPLALTESDTAEETACSTRSAAGQAT